MSKVKNFILLIIVALTVVACGVSKEDIEQEVRMAVREKLNEHNPDPAIWVTDIALIEQGENRYTGMITISDDIMGDGNSETHSITVLCDGESFVWEITE